VIIFLQSSDRKKHVLFLGITKIGDKNVNVTFFGHIKWLYTNVMTAYRKYYQQKVTFLLSLAVLFNLYSKLYNRTQVLTEKMIL
jgi:hypothetical protein